MGYKKTVKEMFNKSNEKIILKKIIFLEFYFSI